jgi:hypothetical protein
METSARSAMSAQRSFIISAADPGAPVCYPLRRGGDEVFEYVRALREIEAQLARCIADLSSDGQSEVG